MPMIPYKEIWDNIVLIQNFNVGFNLKKDKNHIDLTLDDILQIKDEFSFDTIEYAQNIDDLLINFSEYVDYTFRYKEDSSITRNWFNDSMPKRLYKTLNDLLGIRFIFKSSREELQKIRETFILTCPLGPDKCRIADLERDGYQGLHLYIKLKNNTFPVEIQFWTRTDALLNQYLRDSIYTRFDEPDVLNYAISLRTWLEQLPTVPLNQPIKPYVDYLYEKAFQANCVEAD